MGGVSKFEPELSSLSTKEDIFYFFTMEVFKGMKFSKVQMLRGVSGGQ